jgi:hypothetical protein
MGTLDSYRRAHAESSKQIISTKEPRGIPYAFTLPQHSIVYSLAINVSTHQ